MQPEMDRRDLLKLAAAGTAACLGGLYVPPITAQTAKARLISPGCRRTKVKVAKIYVGVQGSHYPNPDLDVKKEVQFYESQFARLKNELADVEFVVDGLVSSVDELNRHKNALKQVDGILAIHLTLATMPIFQEILQLGRPTMIFAAPYSGHEWHSLTRLYKQKEWANFECLLTSDHSQLAVAVRPFRAIHHLREAKVLNLSTRDFQQYAQDVKNKFGAEIKQLALPRVVEAYNAVSQNDAKAEARRWINDAVEVVEPSEEEVVKSCRLALAFERLMDREEATVMTADCYGSMFGPLCQTYAYPCLGFARLNNMGLGGICQSDLPCAMTHILFQGLTGRPGFVENPGFDFSANGAVLIHCMGTPKMDGPDGPAAPYRLRSVMERKEGVTPEVTMRVGQSVTQAVLDGTSNLLYFTGRIVDAPQTDRGCRSKIMVKIDGDAERLWQNWSGDIHRVTCYGDVTKDLRRFCRFQQINMIDETV